MYSILDSFNSVSSKPKFFDRDLILIFKIENWFLPLIGDSWIILEGFILIQAESKNSSSTLISFKAIEDIYQEMSQEKLYKEK